MADTVRVLIADDDPLVRVGLSLVLGAAPEIRIVGERVTARRRSRCAAACSRTSC